MSIEKLETYGEEMEERLDDFRKKNNLSFVSDFEILVEILISILKDQSDEIASLKQKLAQNPDYTYVPRMEGTDNVDNSG